MLTRRVVLSGLLSATAVPVQAQIAASPRPMPRKGPGQALSVAQETDRIIAEAGLSGAVALRLIDARDGRILLDRDGQRPLPPASVAKSITAAYALDHLGAGHRFATRLIAHGPIRDGRLAGDLVLAGGGAPTLDSDGLAELVAGMQAAGIRQVGGRFLWWDGALPHIAEIEPGQPDHLGYNPSGSGLNLNFNRGHFSWRRAEGRVRTEMDARTGSRLPGVTVIEATVADRAQPIFIHETDSQTGTERWSVAARALGVGGSLWLPVRDGGAYAADVLRTLAGSAGVDLPAPEKARTDPAGPAVATVVSAPLHRIAQGMLRHSTNLTAEVLGLTASAVRAGGMPVDLAASADQMTAWAGDTLGMADSHFADHSGLSGDSRTTPADLCGAYARLGAAGPLRPLLRDIGLADPGGRMLPITVAAKTGTLNFVSCLGGYLEPENGPPMIFAIQTVDPERRAAIPPGQEDNPPGTALWTRRSRRMQFDLLRLWGSHAGTDPQLGG
ncbi:MAG: D-alanyl-D-alanine carboxypeptidase/D-alanyl-D-alanine-endopeptidase [Qingshengfaniella sp.]